MATPFDNVVVFDPYGPASADAPPLPMPVQNIAPTPAAVAPQTAPPTTSNFDVAGVPGFATALPPVPGGQVFQPNPTTTQGGLNWDAIERSIMNIEGGRPDTRGPRITNRNSAYYGDTAEGMFGQMGNDIGYWSERALGRRVSREEFRANPEIQRAVFRAHFSDLLSRFGNPTDAAQAYFAGPDSVGRPGALDRTDAQQGFSGTSVRNYRRLFESGLSRYPNGAGAPGFQPQTMEMSPEMASAMGAASTTVPAPGAFSPTAAAIAPGLAAAITPPPTTLGPPGVGPQGNEAPLASGTGGLPFGDLWSAMGARPSGLTQLASYMAQKPAASQIAAGRLFQRAQEIQQANPGITPQMVAQQLVRDPIFGQNALVLGADGPAVLNAIVQPVAPPQVLTGQPGSQFFTQQNGQISPTGQGVPPTPPQLQQLAQWLLSLPADQRELAVNALSQMRQAQSLPSDREQAWARLQALDPATYTPELRDKWLAGLIRPEQVVNEFNQVVGSRWVDTTNGLPIAMSPSRNIGLPSATTVAPGAGGTGAPSAAAVPPPAAAPGAPPSSQPRQGINTEVVPLRGQTNTGQDVEIRDIPGVQLRSPVIQRPEEIVGSVGPVGIVVGLFGGLAGNIPGLERMGEETLRRQASLNDLRAAYARYQEGRQLAGEHKAAMATLPSNTDIFSNPQSALGQLITARSGIVNDIELSRELLKDPNLASDTKRKLSEKIALGMAVLNHMPNIQSMVEARSAVLQGNRSMRTGDENFSTIYEAVTGEANRLMGRTGAPPSRDLQKMDDQKLFDYFKNPGLSQEEKERVRLEAIRRRSLRGAKQ